MKTRAHEPASPVDVLYLGFVLGHGGDALQMLELAAGVSGRGKSVRVIVPHLQTTEDFAVRCQKRGVPVLRSPLMHADAWHARQNIVGLVRLLRAHRARLIHIHTGDVCLPRLLVLAMDLLRVPPAIATLQGPYPTLRPGEPRALAWAAAVRRRFHRVMCPSRHSYQDQVRYGVPEERLDVIPNSVDVPRFSTGDREVAMKQLGMPADTPLVVFSSRLEPQKRPLDAVRAFAAAAPHVPRARLVFVGSGTMLDEMRAAAASLGIGGRVHFVGYQNNVPDWLAAASVWLLPTESENFSLAVLEALAAGCPVVSTDCPGNDEVLVDGENAIVTRVGDTAAMAEGIRRVLTDRALAGSLSFAAVHTAREYSVDSMVDRVLRSYHERNGSARDAFATPEDRVVSV